MSPSRRRRCPRRSTQLDTAFAWAKVGHRQREWRPTRCSAPASSPGSARRARASGRGSRGSSDATRCGRRSASTSIGDFATVRTALEFLQKFQRADGKIPHEISQSASLIPWFTDYPYPWASADATPLYVIAHADYWRATGDRRVPATRTGTRSSRRSGSAPRRTRTATA